MSEFHIHVDAEQLSNTCVHDLVTGYGFVETNFCGFPAEAVHCEPAAHLTYKCYSGIEFRRAFEATRAYLGCTDMRGYLEGEYVAADVDLPEQDFHPEVGVPGRLQLTTLPPGCFRETEIHITMDAERSDPRLISALCGSGLLGAYLPKPYGKAVVFTAQGHQAQILEVFHGFSRYLQRAGGAVSCSIKEERVIRWWLSQPGVAVPPIVDHFVPQTVP